MSRFFQVLEKSIRVLVLLKNTLTLDMAVHFFFFWMWYLYSNSLCAVVWKYNLWKRNNFTYEVKDELMKSMNF